MATAPSSTSAASRENLGPCVVTERKCLLTYTHWLSCFMSKKEGWPASSTQKEAVNNPFSHHGLLISSTEISSALIRGIAVFIFISLLLFFPLGFSWWDVSPCTIRTGYWTANMTAWRVVFPFQRATWDTAGKIICSPKSTASAVQKDTADSVALLSCCPMRSISTRADWLMDLRALLINYYASSIGCIMQQQPRSQKPGCGSKQREVMQLSSSDQRHHWVFSLSR